MRRIPTIKGDRRRADVVLQSAYLTARQPPLLTYNISPMPDLKDVLQRIRATKKQRRELTTSFKDVLAQSKPYQTIVEDLKELKVKKLRIETEIKQEFVRELEKAERLTQNLKTDEQLLSDMALTKFMKGETIDIVDENDVKYEPVFKVSFKKSN